MSRYHLGYFFGLCLVLHFTQATAQVQLSSGTKTSYSHPREYEIAGVTVLGTENLDEGAIRLLSGLAVGDKIEIPSDKTSEALKKLWKQDLFSDVQLLTEKIEGNKIYLVIQIKERPRLSRFKFKGVSKSEADDIREKVNLYKEKIVTENLIISTKQKVYQFYSDKGYRAAEVNIISEADSVFKNHVFLTIDVNKRKKVKIEAISVGENSYYSDFEIKRKLKETKEKTYFHPFEDLDSLALGIWHDVWNDSRQIPITGFNHVNEHIRVRIFKSSKYIEADFKTDQEKIIAKYNQKGFRDARIAKDSVYNSGEIDIAIDLNLNEGYQYYFRSIKWIGNTKYPSDKLTEQLGIKRGDIYDPVKLESRLFMDPNGSDITSIYMDDGYLFFQLTPVEILVGKDSIDLEIRIYEGEQARIRRVTVSGNTKTNDHVVLRSLYTVPGQLFSRADIIRSQRELTVLGFFDPEQMNVIPTPDPSSGTVDIEYVVAEKPNDQLQLQGGYGGGILVATVGIQFNNFSTKNILKPKKWNGPLPTGDGQKLGLSINSNGRQYQAGNLSFTDPWLGGKKPITFSLSGFYSFFSDGARKYNETDSGKFIRSSRMYFQRVGITSQIGKQLTWPDNYFSLIFEGSAQQYTLQNYNQFFFNTGQAYNLYLKFKLSRYSLNDNTFPTAGSDMGFSGQFTPPYSYFNGKDYSTLSAREKFKLLEYHKWKFTWDYYTTLAGRKKRKLVLRTKVGLGVLGYYNRAAGLVPFERFYLGGDPFSTTGIALGGIDSREFVPLRGFDGGGLSPSNGATMVSKYTMEVRYPFSTNPSAMIYGLAFAEAGNSWDSFKQYNPLDVYKSTGVGIRIFLPMFGLLGVDWAYRLSDTDNRTDFPTNANNQRTRFHFTLGYQFGDL